MKHRGRQAQAYRISGIFCVGLIFAEFATSLKSPKIDKAKDKPYYMSSLRVFEIAKIRRRENLTHLLSVVFAKISRREKFPIYGIFIGILSVFAQNGLNLTFYSVNARPKGPNDLFNQYEGCSINPWTTVITFIF